ncbi:Hypothetical protein ORPV_542 [Orpheovirus IHUMI-LCC2]|uniref:Uncharacterized protein n=1 Tax=Orpheovirus IHUMI-LCC2 TaxID=2023057 RepID=A0A2I2L4I6_9VIRU|nr:Hypothetical protein ORPV_542 [Orpheovirus IHUMI-LCC2]SNW62446.1 Hypothetical protein ORPV_542 [Orpheovirus IHUMI-LCC2]
MGSYIELLPLDIIKNELLPNLSQRNIMNVLKAFPLLQEKINISDYILRGVTIEYGVAMDAVYQIDEFLTHIKNIEYNKYDEVIHYVLICACRSNNILIFKSYLQEYKLYKLHDLIYSIIINKNGDMLDILTNYVKSNFKQLSHLLHTFVI